MPGNSIQINDKKQHVLCRFSHADQRYAQTQQDTEHITKIITNLRMLVSLTSFLWTAWVACCKTWAAGWGQTLRTDAAADANADDESVELSVPTEEDPRIPPPATWAEALTEKITDEVAQKTINGLGYNSTSQILRSDVNAVKTQLIKAKKGKAVWAKLRKKT